MPTLDLDDMTIGKKIAHLLVDLGIEQKDLAVRTGLSEASISRWAGGKRLKVSYGDAFKLAQALDVNLYWLCDDGQGYPPPSGPFRHLGVIDVPQPDPSGDPRRNDESAPNGVHSPADRPRER